MTNIILIFIKFIVIDLQKIKCFDKKMSDTKVGHFDLFIMMD